MIIGRGLIANGFKSYEHETKVLIFASGVSNSNENSELAFEKEKKILLQVKEFNNLDDDYLLVYFSTTSLLDVSQLNNYYVNHKKSMEKLVKEFDNFIIFRLPQIVGKSNNPNTLVNFLYKKVLSEERFDLWMNAKRDIIDIEDTFKICRQIIEEGNSLNKIINIGTGVDNSIKSIVKCIERLTGKKALYQEKNLGGTFKCDLTLSLKTAEKISLNFKDDYLSKTLKKYYIGAN
jgi:nucleoside-diphosphate-sugar epimerase